LHNASPSGSLCSPKNVAILDNSDRAIQNSGKPGSHYFYSLVSGNLNVQLDKCDFKNVHKFIYIPPQNAEK